MLYRTPMRAATSIAVSNVPGSAQMPSSAPPPRPAGTDRPTSGKKTSDIWLSQYGP
jgi:hypothetical protein